MKKRAVALILTLATLICSVGFFGCDADYDGEFTTPIIGDTARKNILERIKEYNGTDKLELADSRGIDNYVLSVSGECSNEKTYYNMSSKKEKSITEFENVVKVDLSNKGIDGEGNRLVNQYEKLSYSESYNKYTKKSVDGNGNKSSYVLTKNTKTEKNGKGEIWNSNQTSNIYKRSNDNKKTTYTYYNYMSVKESEKSKNDYGTYTKKNEYKSKDYESFSLNDKISLEKVLKPLFENGGNNVVSFKKDIVIYTGNNKVQLLYQPDDFKDFDDEFLERIFHISSNTYSISTYYDSQFTTYEAVIVFDDQVGQFKCRVKFNTKFDYNYYSSVDTNKNLNYNSSTEISYVLELKTNGFNGSVNLPSDKESFYDLTE